MGTLFPVFFVSRRDGRCMQLGAALVVGVVAAAVPAWRAARVRIVDGLRADRLKRRRWRIPVSYIARNLLARKLTTALTAGGMALVVYVFATVLMLAAGLEQTLVATGQPDNVVVIRRGAQTEVQSGVDRASGGDRRVAAGHRHRRGRRAARVEGAGGAHQPAEARLGQAVQRRDPRRHRRTGSRCGRR